MSRHAENLAGQQFGRLTVIDRVVGTSPIRWRCRCDCGVERDALAGGLKRGDAKDCRGHRLPAVWREKKYPKRRTLLPERICEWCQTPFHPKEANRLRFCSRACSYQYNSRTTVSKSCELCSSPFEGIPSKRHCDACLKKSKRMRRSCPLHFVGCVRCGLLVATNNPIQKFCSAACRTPKVPRQARACEDCGMEVVGTASKRFCSDCTGERNRGARRVLKAKHGGSKHRHRARYHGVAYEAVDPLKVFERDGWRCKLCGIRTPRKFRGTFAPNAPELDHIIPMSIGGEHSYRNTQCACRSCNGAKGARPMGQLRLFG